jgi:hypothetical protein
LLIRYVKNTWIESLLAIFIITARLALCVAIVTLSL